MKQHYRIYFLTCLLCGMMTSAKATTGDIINENFSKFSGINYATTSCEGWTLNRCVYVNNTAFPGCLKFDDLNNGKSSATTKTFSNLTGTSNAVMTFRYANTADKKNASFSVTINGGGTFPNGRTIWNTTITTDSKVFNDATLKLVGVTSTTYVTIKLTSTNEYYFVLDDVVISTADQVTLTDNVANSLATKVADVTVGRTLTGGVWNTLCLPFNAGKNTIAQATGNAVDGVSLRTFSGYDSNTLTFAAVDTVTAGTPFLVKLAQTAINPTFPLASLKGNISSSTRTVTYNGASMIGVFDPTDIASAGLFLTASGALKKATTSSTTLKGLRAYFIVPGGASARLVLDDNATAIKTVEATETADRWYATDGRLLGSQPTRRGIYIRNGQKVIIK